MSDVTTWVTCTTHAAKFPAGWEDSHRAGPLGEQNTTGACVFSYPPATPADATTHAEHVEHAERLALALLMGEVPEDDIADAHAQLAMHNRAAEVGRQARALAAYRAGEHVWTWPASAPWAGFGDAR